MGFTAGPYRWTFGGQPLGIVEDAPRLQFSYQGQPINSDIVGGGPIDYIFTGLTGTLELVFQEFTSAGVQLMLKALSGQIGKFANLGCPIVNASADVLHGVAIDAAQCLTGAGSGRTFVAFRAAIAPNQPIDWTMGGRLRQVSARFSLFPYAREGMNTITNSAPETKSSPVGIFELIDGVFAAPPTKADAIDLATWIGLST